MGTPDRADRWTAVVLGGVTQLVYLRSLLPGVGFNGDTAKWQFLGQVGGVPHPTGYPLYLLVNRGFVAIVPRGSLAWRANLLSAVLGAVAVALLFLLIRELGTSRGPAAAGAATLAVTPTFWTNSVIAEVYTLHIVLMATTLLCVTRWRGGGPDRWLRAGLVVYALSFGNHMGMVLLLPALAWLLWPERQRAVNWGNTLWAGVGATVGAAQYAYVILLTRKDRYVEQPLEGVGDVAGYVTGSYFRRRMFAFPPAELVTSRLELAGRILVEDLMWLLPLVALGLWWAFRRTRRGAGTGHRAGPEAGPESGRRERRVDRDLAVALILWAMASAVFAINYDVPNLVVFFLPVFVVAGMFAGLGLDAVATWVGSRPWTAARAPAAQRWFTVAGTACLLVVPVATGLGNYRTASQRGNEADAARIEAVLTSAGRDAVLLTDGYDDSEYVWYFLLGEGWAEERNLALADMVTPEEVARHLAGDGGPVEHAAGLVAERSQEDHTTLPLFVTSEHQARDLREHGVPVHESEPGIWVVDPADPGR